MLTSLTCAKINQLLHRMPYNGLKVYDDKEFAVHKEMGVDCRIFAQIRHAGGDRRI